jgi:hypothetical protein
VREIDRQYERNNNCEVDNGVYNSDDPPVNEKSKNQFNPFDGAIESEELPNEEEIKPRKKCIATITTAKPLTIDDEIVKIIEGFGFPKSYIECSLLKDEMNHATATYYLIADEKVAH